MSLRRAAMLVALGAAACSSSPDGPVRDAGVNRIFATVRGVT